MTTACPKCSACGCDATAETCLLRELRAQLTHEREARAKAEARLAKLEIHASTTVIPMPGTHDGPIHFLDEEPDLFGACVGRAHSEGNTLGCWVRETLRTIVGPHEYERCGVTDGEHICRRPASHTGSHSSGHVNWYAEWPIFVDPIRAAYERGRRDAQEEARPYREQQDEKLAKAEAECERLREHARIVSDAAAAGVLTLGHILPLRACLPEFSAPPPAKEGT